MKTQRRVEILEHYLADQGLTEGFFESAEPNIKDLSMEEFLERFGEGQVYFWGKSNEDGWLSGDTFFSHIIPEPPQNLDPPEGADDVDPDAPLVLSKPSNTTPTATNSSPSSTK